MTAQKPLVAGNWKMNGLGGALEELRALKERVARGPAPMAEIMVCPPATLLAQARQQLSGSTILLGAQDCHPLPRGPHTGDISAEMLADAGARAVILGHSERRNDHNESNALVNAKAKAAFRAGLTAIICVGETAAERQDGTTLAIVGDQLEASLPREARAASCVIAYEPVWAIGSGVTPTMADIAAAHHFIRETLVRLLGTAEGKDLRILYGGSVKPENARALRSIPDVNGALVGGASLKVGEFYPIVSAYSD